jgi:hypothetical protein
MGRSTRQWVSRWMIAALLLAQWLASAYACPRADEHAMPEPGVALTAPAVTADCHGAAPAQMDPANPALCKAHCDADKQAPVVKAQGDVPSAALAWSIVAGPALHDVLPAPMHARGEVLCAGPPGWPPLYLIHQVLRN